MFMASSTRTMVSERRSLAAITALLVKALRALLVPETDDRIIRVAHDNPIASGMALPPLADPQVIDVVQVDIREEWRNHCPLWCPLHSLDPAALFEYPCR